MITRGRRLWVRAAFPPSTSPRRRDARTDIAAIAITGKPFMLAAGADLSAFAKITERDQAWRSPIGHAVFDKLNRSPVPTFAFINGLALGGGLNSRCTATTDGFRDSGRYRIA